MMAGVTQTLKTMSRNRWTSFPPTGTLPVPALAALLFIGAFFLVALPAHSQNEIVQNPEAVLLRNVWMVQGSPGDRVGAGIGSVGDINGDLIGDFAVLSGRTSRWSLFYGGVGDTIETPAWTFDDAIAQPAHPVRGQFWGPSPQESGVGFMRREQVFIGDRTRYFHRLFVYRNEDGALEDEATLVLDPEETIAERLEYQPVEVYAADLDLDQDDELIVIVSVTLIDQVADKRAEVWIFEGGPDFQLDTPSVVLKDTEENYTNFNATIGNLDGDPYPDLLIAGDYTDGEPGNRPVRMKLWWGKANLAELSPAPDRSVRFTDPLYPRITFARPFLPLFDTDGDSVQEFLLPGSEGAWYYYDMSAEGKDPRSREFTLEDADGSYRGFNLVYKVGYLNDSLRRYEMIGRTGGGSPGGDARLVLMSGGKKGANLTFDGYYSASDDGLKSGNIFGVDAIVENCTGTGWDCYLTGNPRWGDNDEGIVVLLEGGAYIPNDDTTLSVWTVGTDEHSAALHVWPNPVIDELHIAWRGDLKRLPSLMVVYDDNGREMTSGAVEAWRGEAIWQCSGVSAGTYLLAIYDKNGKLLATTRVVKQ